MQVRLNNQRAAAIETKRSSPYGKIVTIAGAGRLPGGNRDKSRPTIGRSHQRSVVRQERELDDAEAVVVDLFFLSA